MFRVAVKMLMGDRSKYLTLVSSLMVVSFLFLQQGSIFCGLMLRTARAVEVVGAPIWVTDPQLRSVDESKPLLDTDLQRVRSVHGVKWAVPLLLQLVSVHLPDGNFQTVRLFGLDNDTFFGRPKMLSGSSNLLTQDQAVIIGNAEKEKLNNPKPGDILEMNDTQARVVGIADVPRDFFSYPFVYAAYDRALQYAPQQRKQMNYVLAAPVDGVPIDQVTRNIQKTTGLTAYTETQFRWLTIGYYFKNTGIPISIGISLAMVFLVGMSIVGQTFYQFALQNERYFGALKAMGTNSLTLTKMILLQALIVGLVGFGSGAGLGGIFGLLAGGQDSKIAFATPWPLLVFSFVLIMAICLLSALISIQKVVRLEPAVVFRG
ncbi:MAG TPA: ABC transporter permease [Acidisarcina sp.]